MWYQYLGLFRIVSHGAYSAKDELTLPKILKMEEVVIDNKSVLVGHGYVQHSGVEWEGEHAVW